MLDENLLRLLEGDCCHKLKELEDDSVDLIVTSPPYAEQRKGKYAGVAVSEYSDWFLPIAAELKRILKPSGSFFLNLKAHCEKGERSLYVMELVLKLRNEVGLKFVDEYVWYKSAAPRRKTFRLKNSWEPFYHFSLGQNYINHDAIKRHPKHTFVQKKGWCDYGDSGNVGGYHEITKQGEGWTDPDNVLYFPTSLMVKDKDKYPHPAKFPLELVKFLIRGFCPPKGIVCDPFVGSGITACAALSLDCQCVAIELESKFCQMTLDRIRQYSPWSYQGKNIQGYPDLYDIRNQ